MKIKYAGPKAIFTKHGVEFDNNKDDKYVYLGIGAQLLKAFDKDCSENEQYIYDVESKRLSDAELMEFVIENFSNYKELISKAQEDAKVYFDKELSRVEIQKPLLNEIEYKSWIKNIQLMKKYVIQRHFNKDIYYAIITKIGKILKEKHIKEIHAPMFQRFVHVLHSIKGVLEDKPEPRVSNMDIYEKDGVLMVRINIK